MKPRKMFSSFDGPAATASLHRPFQIILIARNQASIKTNIYMQFIF